MGTKIKPGAFDCYAAAEPDEPMFVLLARDELAGTLVVTWAALRIGDFTAADEALRTAKHIARRYCAHPDLKKALEASECASAMTQWIHTHRPGKLDPKTAPPPLRTGDVMADALPSCARGEPWRELISDAERDAGETGHTLTDLANAVQIWSAMQGCRISLAQAARVFNCTPALIADAVRAHHWLYIETQGGALLDDPETSPKDLAGEPMPQAIDDYARCFIAHEGE